MQLQGEPKPKQRISIPTIIGFVSHMAAARLSGGYKVTPFFDASGEPVAVPGDGPSRPGVANTD